MCMLFVKPETLALPRAYFDSLHESNADGVSCYNFTTKELFQTLDYEIAFKYLQDNAKDKMIVHFRFGTSGQATIEQLHGWDILGGRYHFFHNGVLSTFNGSSKKSDTQQLVDVINSCNVELNKFIEFLETFETGSRFIILDKKTQEIIVPNCAKWNEVININGCPVQFSNTYAISAHLQMDDGHLIQWEKPKSKKWTSSYNSDWARSFRSEIVDVDSLNDDLFEDVNDNDYLDANTLDEIEYIIQNLSYKDVLDLVLTNPTDVARYLTEYVK